MISTEAPPGFGPRRARPACSLVGNVQRATGNMSGITTILSPTGVGGPTSARHPPGAESRGVCLLVGSPLPTGYRWSTARTQRKFWLNLPMRERSRNRIREGAICRGERDTRRASVCHRVHAHPGPPEIRSGPWVVVVPLRLTDDGIPNVSNVQPVTVFDCKAPTSAFGCQCSHMKASRLSRKRAESSRIITQSARSVTQVDAENWPKSTHKPVDIG